MLVTGRATAALYSSEKGDPTNWKNMQELSGLLVSIALMSSGDRIHLEICNDCGASETRAGAGVSAP